MKFQQIPPSIVQAICQVQSHVDAVKKTSRNQHGGYMFASTDDIYAAVMREQAAAGLTMPSLERKREVVRIEKDGKTVVWLDYELQFLLATTDATWTDEWCKRGVFCMITGPQTFQAAQSYCEKAFLRSLYKLPTGDMDLDAMAQADTEEAMIAMNNGGNKKRKSSYAAKKDGTADKFNEIRAAINEAISPEMLMHVRETYADDWNDAPTRWHEILEGDYETKMIALRGQML